MYLRDPILNVLNFSVFGHTSCGKHDVPWYVVEETNSIYMHEVTANGDLIVPIKDSFRNTWYINRPHMLNLAPHCCVLGVVWWVHRYPQPLQHLLVVLKGSAEYYYQLHKWFNLLFDQWCAVIGLRDQFFLCHSWCIISYLTSLVVWVNVSR